MHGSNIETYYSMMDNSAKGGALQLAGVLFRAVLTLLTPFVSPNPVDFLVCEYVAPQCSTSLFVHNAPSSSPPG